MPDFRCKMLQNIMKRLRTRFSHWVPHFHKGQLVVYRSTREDTPFQPAVVDRARFIRPAGEKNRRWVYDLVVFRFNKERVVCLSCYTSTVFESQLCPVDY